MDLIGWLGSIFLAVSSVPQVIKTVRDGHADGLSWAFVALVLIGAGLSLVYVTPGLNWPLIANYGSTVAIFGLIGYYKMFPRFSRKATLTRQERLEIIDQIKKVEKWQRQ